MLDELNRQLRPHGLWFPVDISTGSRATIGGMVGNNSCGARSLRYGNTRENVVSIDAVLADGSKAHFGPVAPDLSDLPADFGSCIRSRRTCSRIGRREAQEIEARFPKVQRRVGGYNLDALTPGRSMSSISRTSCSAPKARSASRPRSSEAPAAAQAARSRRLPFRPLLAGDGGGPAYRQAWTDRGGTRRSDHDRAGLRHRHVPPGARTHSCAAEPAAVLLVEFGEDDQQDELFGACGGSIN